MTTSKHTPTTGGLLVALLFMLIVWVGCGFALWVVGEMLDSEDVTQDVSEFLGFVCLGLIAAIVVAGLWVASLIHLALTGERR